MKSLNLAIFPGDGVGNEIIKEAIKVLRKLVDMGFFKLEIEFDMIGKYLNKIYN